MIKKISILSTLLLLIFSNCSNKKEYFAGDIIYFNNFPSIDSLYGNKIELSGIYTDNMLVYDSLILFSAQQYPDFHYYVFSLNSGNQLGSFCRKGEGPQDYIVLGDTKQFTIENKAIKLWTRDVMKEKLQLLDLTKSIANNETVIDTIISGHWKGEFNRPFSFAFVLKDNLIAMKNQPEIISNDGLTYLPGSYFLYNTTDPNPIQKFTLYNYPVINPQYTFDNYLHSIDRIKPDNTKIAMGMSLLSQINILDIKSGKLIGIRTSGTPDFKDLEKKTTEIKFYYSDICIDNEYIYGLYSNKIFNDQNYPFVSNEVHVFDWEGNAIRKLILDREFDRIALDPVKKKLYAKNDEDEVFCFDI